MLLPFALACSRPSPEPAQRVPTSPVVSAPASITTTALEKRGTVIFKLPPGDKSVSVEVVNSPAAIERGLMFRQHMAPDDGMLFLMPDNQVHTFWMHNTLIPLDMLFITKEFTVTGIVENAEPQTDTLRTVNKVSPFVLEMNGGWCKANGVTDGTKVEFSDLEAAAR
jgi:uncharacterized protein